MIIRNCLPGDAEQEARVYNSVAAKLPGFAPLSVEEIRRATAGRGFESGTRLYAEDAGNVVGYTWFEPSGRIHYPWCLPGHEKMAHPLVASVFRALGERRIQRAYTTCRADWTDQIEFFEDHGFDKARDIVNFMQSIGDLPTMFQRPGLDVSTLRPTDIPAIEQLVPGLLRLHGNALGAYLLDNSALPADALYVLRKDGTPRGLGMLIDNAAFAGVETLDPKAPAYRFGAFGTEGLPSRKVNGLFSFLAGPGKDAQLIAQDLLWYGTQRMEENSFEMLAAQVPNDVPHLLNFYERYFQKQGCFSVLEREVGTGSSF